MNSLHAAIEEFHAEGCTHLEANCPRCRFIRLRPIDQLPKISMGLTLVQVDILTISRRLGHYKPSVTLDTYGHLIEGADAEAAKAIASVMGTPGER